MERIWTEAAPLKGTGAAPLSNVTPKSKDKNTNNHRLNLSLENMVLSFLKLETALYLKRSLSALWQKPSRDTRTINCDADSVAD
jgi:hypothetical protein